VNNNKWGEEKRGRRKGERKQKGMSQQVMIGLYDPWSIMEQLNPFG